MRAMFPATFMAKLKTLSWPVFLLRWFLMICGTRAHSTSTEFAWNTRSAIWGVTWPATEVSKQLMHQNMILSCTGML